MAIIAQVLGYDTYKSVGFNDNYAYAQTFTLSEGRTIHSLSLNFRRADTEESAIYRISIRSTSGSTPLAGAGNDLWYGDFNSSTIEGSFEWITASLSLVLTAGLYAICVKLLTGSAIIHWSNENDNVYGGGANWLSFNDGDSSWVTSIGDMTFIIEGTARAINPGPEDDEEDVNRITNLTWEPGDENIDSYDVYFGTVGNIALVAAGILKDDESFDIADYTGGLALATEYEWRIDSYEGIVKATGDVWSYTTRAQRTVVLSSPANLSENNLTSGLTISWTIDGIGAQYGSEEDQDFLFIYIRKDDANFTEDDLVANFVQAFYNDDLSISRLHYGATYYWQVQAGNTAADLADSEVWSFDTLDFLPPTYSTREKLVYGEPGGPGDPGGDPSGEREYETIPSGENNMLTVRRLIAATKNKIFYEDT